ncbi:MAG: hydrogenase nickel incorporation protein HypB [Methylophilaceae bacterium]|nr:hydrogenase nickel incorporation protein HypB [Methylophilaceae bacterium]
MCTTCGCGQGETRIEGRRLTEPVHAGAGGRIYRHVHAHDESHDAAHPHHPLQFHAHGMPQGRRVKIEQDILARNNGYAAANRSLLERRGILALNLVSSPGSGKTTLLVNTIAALQGRVPLAVIEGDQQTAHDAERIRAAGAPAVQINTGKGCHLDAHMVGHALDRLELMPGSVLFIENVGNLVCPAAFDLGEAAKVVILSVTEGEDKPLKYPDMFRAARLMLLNKCDLLPYVQFDVERAAEHARRINPAIEIIRVSATSGAGMEDWLAWLARERTAVVRDPPPEREAVPSGVQG